METLSAEFVRDVFDYDWDTGLLTWRKMLCSRFPAGSKAGSGRSGRYRRVRILKKSYLEHRVVWLYAYGKLPLGQIDHINGDPSDNRLANLRAATPTQNLFNTRRPSSNTSGVKGVTWYPDRQKWVAKIKINRKQIHLGTFETIEEATDARRSAATALCGEFTNHG